MGRLGWLGLAMMGCDPPTSCELAARTDPGLSLGEGQLDFVPVTEGMSLTAESGPQGGQHVWGALRAQGLAPGGYNLLGEDAPAPKVEMTVFDEGENRTIGTGRQLDLPWKGDEEEAETVGVQIYLDADWYEIVGPFLLMSEVTDSCGTTLTAQQAVGL